MGHLGHEGRGGRGLVLPGRGELLGRLVVTREAVNTALDENEAELGVLVAAVALQVLAHRDRLLDHEVQVLGDLGRKTLALQVGDDVITRKEETGVSVTTEQRSTTELPTTSITIYMHMYVYISCLPIQSRRGLVWWVWVTPSPLPPPRSRPRRSRVGDTRQVTHPDHTRAMIYIYIYISWRRHGPDGDGWALGC